MYDTIIIGAGISGLAAGKYLADNGCKNFLVLEYADKIGGRIGTTEFNGEFFSTGPCWVHGQTGNPVYGLIKELGIRIEKCIYDENAFFVWDVKEKKDVTEIFIEKSLMFDEIFEDVSEKVSETVIDAEESVFDVLCEHYDILRNQSDIDKIVIFINKEIYLGASLNQVSGKVDFQITKVYSFEEDEINHRIIDPLGMTKVIEYLSQSFDDKIKLNTNVSRIVWSLENHRATLLTNDGQEFQCKNVIVTLQSDLLAKNTIIFEPEVPPEKVVAWKHIPAVNYCRIFARFPRKFWPAKEWLISVTENVNPFEELILWQNGHKQNLCSDENILICHFTSAISKGVSRFDVDDDSLRELVTESMRNMFPETYCSPDEVSFISHSNRNGFSGAFSIPACGIDDNMMRILEESVGPLYFAGESVKPSFLGTMQAAYVTGIDAARHTLQ